MIVDLTRGRGFPIVLYDTATDVLSTQTRLEFEGHLPEYWRSHPEHPGLLVGYVLSERDPEEDEDGNLVRLEPYDEAVALKLTRASLEPRWSVARSTQLHSMSWRIYEGIPCMGLVHEMCDAIRLLGEWLDSRQLKLDFGEMAER